MFCMNRVPSPFPFGKTQKNSAREIINFVLVIIFILKEVSNYFGSRGSTSLRNVWLNLA